LASRLIRKGGDIFVDDCDRAVEEKYTDRYLGKDHFVLEVKSRSVLRWYRKI
jgi:hypothetical protein